MIGKDFLYVAFQHLFEQAPNCFDSAFWGGSTGGGGALPTALSLRTGVAHPRNPQALGSDGGPSCSLL